jgi:predicted AlkP superfamily pyrophosphatase or phosphodiesterase
MTVVRRGRVAGLLFVILAASGCTVQPSSQVLWQTDNTSLVQLSAREDWTDTGLDVPDGAVLHVEASGEIEICRWNYWGRPFDWKVGPRGTYNIDPAAGWEKWPLAAGQMGPAPAYALIGRFGEDGHPFFVGEEFTEKVPKGGRLFLGVNDFNCRDNKGVFQASATFRVPAGNEVFVRVDNRRIETGSANCGPSNKRARVLILYVDGLRCDVLKEMAYAGYLPHIKREFFDNGADLVNSFTVFTPDTLPANGALWTGTFPGRNGMVAGIAFDRESESIIDYYDKWASYDAADFLSPTGWHRAGLTIEDAARKVLTREEDYRKFEEEAWRGVKGIWDYVPDAEHAFGTTIMPISPRSIPPHWLERGSNVMPPMQAHKYMARLDEIETDFTCRNIIRPEEKVITVWLPGVDLSGHESPRGQFGGARPAIQKVDGYIGRILDTLDENHMRDDTVVWLVSDHGHVGGDWYIDQRFDVAKEFLHGERLVEENGTLKAGSGLGLNVRAIKLEWNNKGSDPRDYVFVYDGDGSARMVFPFARWDSRDFRRANRLYELTHYVVSDRLHPVNVPEMLLRADLGERNQFPKRVDAHPVDLVMLPLDDNSVLLMKREGVQGIIDKRGTGREATYRYRIVRGCEQDNAGRVGFDPGRPDDGDPLGYLDDPGLLVPGTDSRQARFAWMSQYHDREEWLRATMLTQRPDGVVGVAEQLLWDPSQRWRSDRWKVDILVTANPGWRLTHANLVGTAHGYFNRDASRNVCMVSGPGIRRGTMITRPVRIVDVLPTTLEITGIPFDPKTLDGRPIREIYDNAPVIGPGYPSGSVLVSGVLTDNGMSMAQLVTPNREGFVVHNPDSFFDLHSIALNVSSLSALDVEGIGNMVTGAVLPGDPRVFTAAADGIVKTYRAHDGSYPAKRFGQLVAALRIREFNVADGFGFAIGGVWLVTEGNWYRLNLLIDWVKDVTADGEAVLAYPIGRKDLVVGPLARGGITGAQYGLEKLRRGVTRELGKFADHLIDAVEEGTGAMLNVMPIPKPQNRD